MLPIHKDFHQFKYHSLLPSLPQVKSNPSYQLARKAVSCSESSEAHSWLHHEPRVSDPQAVCGSLCYSPLCQFRQEFHRPAVELLDQDLPAVQSQPARQAIQSQSTPCRHSSMDHFTSFMGVTALITSSRRRSSANLSARNSIVFAVSQRTSTSMASRMVKIFMSTNNGSTPSKTS